MLVRWFRRKKGRFTQYHIPKGRDRTLCGSTIPNESTDPRIELKHTIADRTDLCWNCVARQKFEKETASRV